MGSSKVLAQIHNFMNDIIRENHIVGGAILLNLYHLNSEAWPMKLEWGMNLDDFLMDNSIAWT